MNGAPLIFYARYGIGYNLTDNASLWFSITHNSNAFMGDINPGKEGVAIGITFRQTDTISSVRLSNTQLYLE